jgi:two-component system chemotaxis response regulator CheB
MICDDSRVIRTAVTRILESDPDIQVVGRAANGKEALDMIRGLDVDVLVLDIEMPVMDGMTALPLLLAADPKLRVVMSSTLTTRGAEIALQALRLGAADYLPKPSASALSEDRVFQTELIQKVRGLARLRRRAGLPATASAAAPAVAGSGITLRPPPRTVPAVLAIGSSTGGPQALFTLVQGLGASLPVPVVATQHMPASFTPILAEHINRLGGLPCAEARDGDRLQPGRIYLAPGNYHLLVNGTPGALQAKLSSEPPENFCRPSVDPMLRSLTRATGGRALLVMLTGMGHDGREGTRELVEAGGGAIAQDEATSVVWGMPGAIAQAGLCMAVQPLPALARLVLETLKVRR